MLLHWVLTPSEQEGRLCGALGLPSPEGCCAVPTSCREPLFTLENLNARKEFELLLPTTNPGPPYSSLHTTGAR